MLNSKRGFTIIEVVLVLAIAGLIFLMVFIALPALQRGQRDNQRRTDVGRLASQLSSYATNNRGQLPVSIDASFLEGYMKRSDGEFRDPKSGENYTTSSEVARGSSPLEMGEVQYLRGYKCDGENASIAGQGQRQAAIRIRLEGSGHFCQNAS